MHIAQVLQRDRPAVSFEFFPPSSPTGWDTLFTAIAELEPLAPSFVSVTYGAGGSTRDRTHELVLRLKSQTSLEPVPHLTCVGHTTAELEAIVARYAEAGVSNLLALRGDRPKAGGPPGELAHAAELVRLIRRFQAGRPIGIGVAGFPEGHPETPNTLLQMDHLKAKVDEGADWICTQLCFDNHAFYDWKERCELAGIRIPIFAGLMPVTSLAGLRRMADLAGGARFPAPLMRALARAGEDADAVARVGIHWATEQCRDLLDHGVRGIHLYTLNRSAATRGIFESLGVRSRAGLDGG